MGRQERARSPLRLTELTRRSLRWCLLCTHTLTHRVNVRTCIIDLRSPLQQTPTVIKKRPFCFISPLHHAYQLICIITNIWCRPRKRLPLWFPLLGILSHFAVSLSAAPRAGAPHRRCILNSNRSGASADPKDSAPFFWLCLRLKKKKKKVLTSKVWCWMLDAEIHILQVKLIDCVCDLSCLVAFYHFGLCDKHKSTSQQQNDMKSFYMTAERIH